MADEAPLVSVVIPTHYRNDWLGRAIESALDQTYEPIEVIVVDDSGESHARPVASEYDVAYVAHDVNRGGNPARNTGIYAAGGSYVQLLDDDDVLSEEKIARQVDLLESSTGVGVAYCGIRDGDGNCTVPDSGGPDDALKRALMFDLPAAPTSSLLVDASVLADVAPLTSRGAADDIGMKIELARRTAFAAIDEVLVHKGEPADARGSSPRFPDELFNIITEYRSLYDRYPKRVLREATARAYQSKGHSLLKGRFWSGEAILAFWLAAVHKRSIDPELVGCSIAALFGSPGWRVASFIYNELLGQRT